VPGGHAGVFTGARAAHTTWALGKDWLSLRSRPALKTGAPAPGEAKVPEPEPAPTSATATAMPAAGAPGAGIGGE